MSEEAEASSVPSLRSQRHFTAWTPLRYVQALRYAPAAWLRQIAEFLLFVVRQVGVDMSCVILFSF